MRINQRKLDAILGGIVTVVLLVTFSFVIAKLVGAWQQLP